MYIVLYSFPVDVKEICIRFNFFGISFIDFVIYEFVIPPKITRALTLYGLVLYFNYFVLFYIIVSLIL